jgi:predicted RNase H-like nuclease
LILAGVDGCRGGWIAVVERDGRRSTEVFRDFAEVVRSEGAIVVIDIPIGIMAAVPRAVDRAARELLGSRACCVFSAPYRPMLQAKSYAEACNVREAIDGKRCSKQAFEISKKIAEVDSVMTPHLQNRVFEGHPEVTFAFMAGGAAVQHRKKSEAGTAARVALLRAHFEEVQAVAEASRPVGVARDDLLDAYAMLWTAKRIAQGTSKRLPEFTQHDDRGLRAEMLA